MNLEITTTERPSYINEFEKLLLSTQSTLSQLCKFYVDDIDKNPDHVDGYLEFFPNLSRQTWRYIELAGRNKAVPEIIFQQNAVVKKLVKCPISEQEKYLKEPIPVLDPKKPGDHLLIMYTDMQRDQIEQVFAFDHVRTLAEQKAWLLSQSSKKRDIKLSDGPKRPKVIGGVLNVYEPTKITLQELTAYLQEMTR
jgi:hypothetical protein